MDHPRIDVVCSDSRLTRALSRVLGETAELRVFAALPVARDVARCAESAGIIIDADWCDGPAMTWLESLRDREVACNRAAMPALVTSARCERALVNAACRLAASLLCRPFERADLGPFIAEAVTFRAARKHGELHARIALALSRLTLARQLTENEAAIIRGALNGLSREELASLRGISINTYKWATRGLLRKVRANTEGEVRDMLRRELLLAGRSRPPASRVAGRDGERSLRRTRGGQGFVDGAPFSS